MPGSARGKALTKRFAAIDIGTNTILLLVADMKANGTFRVLDDRAEITRLGEGVDRTRRIGSEGEERTVEALRSYLARCRDLGADEVVTAGTSALRDAQNAGTFTTLAAIEKGLARYSHSEVHGSRLSRAEVQRQIELFRKRSVAERRRIPGLEPKRADVILAGAALIDRIMAFFHMDEVTVSDQGIRYGLLHERLSSVYG